MYASSTNQESMPIIVIIINKPELENRIQLVIVDLAEDIERRFWDANVKLKTENTYTNISVSRKVTVITDAFRNCITQPLVK